MQIVTREEAEALGFSLDYSNPVTAKVDELIPADNSVIPDVSGVLTAQEETEYYENPYAIYHYSNQNEDMTNIYGLTDTTGTGYAVVPRPANRGWHTFSCEIFLNELPQDNTQRILLGGITDEALTSPQAQFTVSIYGSTVRVFLRETGGTTNFGYLSGVTLGYNKITVKYRLTTGSEYEIYLENESGTHSKTGGFSVNFWSNSWDEITNYAIGAFRSTSDLVTGRFIKGVIVNWSLDVESDTTQNLVYDFNDKDTDYNFLNLANNTNDITLVNIPAVNYYLDGENGYRVGKSALEISKPTSRAVLQLYATVKFNQSELSTQLLLFGTGSNDTEYPLLKVWLDAANNRLKIIHKLPQANDTSYNTSYIPFKLGATYPTDQDYHDIVFEWEPWTSTRFHLSVDGVAMINYDDSLLSQNMSPNQWSAFDHFYFNAAFDVYNNNYSSSNPLINSSGDWFIKSLRTEFGGTLYNNIDFSTFSGLRVYDGKTKSGKELIGLNNSGVVKAIQAITHKIGATRTYTTVAACEDATDHIDYVRNVLEIDDGVYDEGSSLTISNGSWPNYQAVIKAVNKGEVTLTALDFMMIRGNWQGINFKSSDTTNHAENFLVTNDPTGDGEGVTVFTDCKFVAEDGLQCIDYNLRSSSTITTQAEYKRCLFVTGESAGNLCVDLGASNQNDYVFADFDQCAFISRNPTSGSTTLVRSEKDRARSKITNSLFYAASSTPSAMSDITGNNRITGYNNISNNLLGVTDNGQESVDMTNWFVDPANGDFQLTETAQAVLEGAGGGGVDIVAWAYAATGGLVPLTKYLTINWSVKELLNSNLNLLWKIREYLDKDITLSWDVVNAALNALSKSLNLSWDVKEQLTKHLQLLWSDLEKTNTTLDLSWNILEKTQSTFAFRWNIYQSLSKDLNLLWHNKEFLSINPELRWNILESLTKTIELNWNDYELVNKNLNLVWNIKENLENTLEIYWHVESDTVVITPEFRTCYVAKGNRVVTVPVGNRLSCVPKHNRIIKVKKY